MGSRDEHGARLPPWFSRRARLERILLRSLLLDSPLDDLFGVGNRVFAGVEGEERNQFLVRAEVDGRKGRRMGTVRRRSRATERFKVHDASSIGRARPLTIAQSQ
jgi:hypothetical protein